MPRDLHSATGIPNFAAKGMTGLGVDFGKEVKQALGKEVKQGLQEGVVNGEL